MNKTRFWISLFAALSSAASALPGVAADKYPTRPIRMIVPYSVGGTSDLVGRLVGAKLSEKLGEHLVVDNRGGGGSTLGTAIVAEANPDGYTIIVNNIGLAVNETLRPGRSYRALKDLAPVSLIGFTPSVLVINTKLPFKNLADFLARARAQPGKIAFGSAGAGSSTHLSMAVLQSMAKIKLLHVPYKGGGPAVRDAIAGNVQCVLAPIPTVYGHLKAGRLRALGITSSKRSPVLPNVPTISSSGVPGYEFSTWYGLLTRAGTPKAIIARLNQAAVSGLADADLREKLLKTGLDPESSTPEKFGRFLRSEITKWAKVIKSAGIPMR